MAQQILFATKNEGKQREITALLETVTAVAPVFATHFQELENVDPAETADTFEGNAEIKAREYGQIVGIPTIAGDAGLEVKALGGKPGVKSKRFYPGSDSDRNQELLRLLAGKDARSAQFVTVFCLYDPARLPSPQFFRGVVKGTIAQDPRGSNGFGYDPIFIPNGYDQTFAELDFAEKNKLSHRSRALQKAVAFIEDTYNQ